MSFIRHRREPLPAIDFSLPDDRGGTVVYDAEFRSLRNSVLVWFRGPW